MRRLFLAFFERLYGPWAAAYEPIAWLVSRGAWPDWVRAARPFVTGPVLEIGPGTGHLLLALATDGVAVTGLDRSISLLTRAQQRLAAAGLGHRVALRQGDAGALPFTDASFATVVTTFPAPFVLSVQVQAEIARVLRPGGSWVVLDGAEPGGRDPWSLLLRAMLARPAPSARIVRRPMPCAAASVSFPARLTAAGYQVSVQSVSVGADRVTVIIARPVPAGQSDFRADATPGR